MSNPGASNVIPMREFDRPAPSPQEAQFERLLKECQVLAMDRLSSSIAAMLDKVEEVLWGLANETPDREVRDLYITAKDKALEQRKLIEEQFRKSYLAEFANRVRADRKQGQDFSRFDLSSLELGLVNDEDLDETLKVNEMSAKLRRYCEEELNALDQRVGVLIGDANLQGEGNPFSPQAICIAYKHTCRQIDTNLKIRMIFHRLFDDHVLDDVRSIYKDLNALLIQRSILPKIRYGIRRQAGAAAARSGLLPAGMPGTSPGIDSGVAGMANNVVYGAEAVAGSEQDFYAVLQGLLAANAHGQQFGGAVAGAGVPAIPGGMLTAGSAPAGGMVQIPGFPPIIGGAGNAGTATAAPGVGTQITGMRVPERPLQGAELIGSLTRLQQGDLGAIAGAPATLDPSSLSTGMTNVVRELKSTQIGSSVDQTDAMTMDIVAMLFDQIFGDKRVPYALKVLIGRLQIPVVKVAVLDKKFFSKKSHPARRLLDTLGDFAFGLDETFDQSSAVYKKLEDIIQRLLDGFEDDIQIFEALNGDLLVLVQEENQRAENAAKEAARKVAYLERLEVGKAVAQFEIKRRAEANRISQLVLKFLADEWVKLLLLTYARHGNDSKAWKSALETMDLLIWSVNHKQSVEERRKLAGMLPGLLKRLQAGLQAVGTSPERRKRFFSRLMRLHTRVISGHVPARRVEQQAIPVLTESVLPRLPSDAESLPERLNGEQPGTPMQPLQSNATEHPTPQDATPSTLSPTETTRTAASEVDEDAEPATQAPEFSNVTIKNPFGEGDIQIEEISLSDLPGVPELSAASQKPASSTEPLDQHSQSVTDLREGDWLEFRDDEDGRTQAKLSYISPLKGTYLFVNRQGAKVGEYSLYQLAREFRTGRAVLLEAVPLLDRAMSGLVGVLRKSVH